MADKSFLKEVPILGALSEDGVDYFISLASEVTLKDNQYLFKEGDKGDTLYLIYSGLISVLRSKSDQSASLEVVKLGPGDALGEMSVFDMCPRSASALSIGKSILFAWRSVDLLSFHQRDVEQFALLQMNIGREISRRLRSMGDQYLKLITHQD